MNRRWECMNEWMNERRELIDKGMDRWVKGIM